MRSSKRWWIGVDGGGTRTTAVLCDEAGTIRAVAVGGPANVQSRPFAQVEAMLNELLRTLLAQAGACQKDVAGVALALAGADRPEAQERFYGALGGTYPRLVVDHDAVAALYAGTWGEPGIVLVAGTGSIAWGLSRRGERVRAGGWGYLLGDEGSGFDLGRRALAAVLRAHDGRGEATALTGLVLAHYGVDSPERLIHLLYGADNPRARMAETAPLVLAAAAQGDAVAGAIVDAAAVSLAELVEACEARLGERLPVVLAGGLFGDRHFSERLRQRLAGRNVIQPDLPPAAGALMLALAASGEEPGEAFKGNLAKSWQAWIRRG